MLTTTNQNHSNNPYPSITPEQARRIGRSALRHRYNPDPAVIDADLAESEAIIQAWMHEGEPYTASQIALRVYVCTRSKLRDACEHGPAGLTGLTTHYEYARRCAQAVEELRMSLNSSCPRRGIEPSYADVIQRANSCGRKWTRSEDWQQSYVVTMPTDLRSDSRDFVDQIVDRDEARRELDEIVSQLSPLAQRALALGLEWGGVIPTARELAEELGVDLGVAAKSLREIKRVAQICRDSSPNKRQGGHNNA